MNSAFRLAGSSACVWLIAAGAFVLAHSRLSPDALPAAPLIVAQETKDLNTNLLLKLQRAQEGSDRVVSIDNTNLDLYGALDTAQKALAGAAGKPSPDVVTAVLGLQSALNAVKDGTFHKWQQDGVPNAGPKPNPALKYRLPKDHLLLQLQAQKTYLSQVMNDLEASAKDKVVPADIQNAYLACQRRLDDAIVRMQASGTVDIEKEAVSHALSIYRSVVGISSAAKSKLDAAAKDIVSAAKLGPAKYSQTLSTALPALGYAARSGEVETVVSPAFAAALGTVTPTLPKYTPTSKDLIASGQAFIVAADASSKALADEYDHAATEASDALSRLVADPRNEALNAHALVLSYGDRIKEETDSQAKIATFVDGLRAKPLSTLIPDDPTEDAAKALESLAKRAKALSLSAARLSVAAEALKADYADNITAWTEAEVNLYYFDDVERLLAMITPNVERKRDNTAAQTYQQSQIDLLKAQEELVSSHARLADVRRQLQNAQEDLRLEQARVEQERERLSKSAEQAGTASDAANAEVREAQSAVRQAQVVLSEATRATARAQSAYDANQDPKKKDALAAALESAKKDQDDAQTTLEKRQRLLADAQDRKADADAKTTAANSNLNALQSNVDALQQKLATAVQADSEKTEALRTASTTAYVDAFTANRNFAQAVDGTPYFVTKRDGLADRLKSSTDPADRVLLYGEPMEKRIVIRGRASDVETVRRLISLLDRPQAQSEITVYSAELSSPTDPARMKRTWQALRVLDTELSRYSLYNDAAQSYLRQAISAVVQNESTTKEDIKTAIKRVVARKEDSTLPPVQDMAPATDDIDIAADWASNQSQQLKSTLVCLDPRVLQSLDLSAAVRGRTSDFYNDLPDLTSPASLAEATMALALLRPDLRAKVVKGFYNGIERRLTDSVRTMTPEREIFKVDDHPLTFRPDSFFGVFDRTSVDVQSIFDSTSYREKSTTSRDSVSVNSSEIQAAGSRNGADVNLLQDGFSYVYMAQHRPSVLKSMEDLRVKLGDLGKEIDEQSAKWILKEDKKTFRKASELEMPAGETLVLSSKKETEVRYLPLEEFLKVGSIRQKLETMAANYREIQLKLVRQLQEAGVRYGHPVGKEFVALLAPVDTLAIAKGSGNVGQAVVAVNAEVNRWYGDFDRAVISFRKQIESVVYGSPDYHRNIARYNMALRRVMSLYYTDVRNALVNGNQGLLVNVDRILDWSKAEVGAWSSETILASNRLAARIDPQATASAAQSSPIDAAGGALVLANLITSSATQNVPQILKGIKDLSGKQREDAPAVYGIGTGNVFEVTPIVDPTGQALRFRFNYVASTRVREPGGVTDRQLNHMEQTSINTEVVLDNLAIKRVGSYQSNVQLGLPSRKTGGLPFFKDIPVLKEIPLLGWFTYRIGGRRPVVQQSIILTQAAIYPTIEDVVGSLNVAYKQR